ncbi:protein translocase subunit SecD [Aestuariimicrobium ganziense]|uniref:protein translocase subunit SecD n=1 Tax=Aestuariimicrobium ganziense TaxID=2773677 RepID=UPI0019407498|nr:protein translocase subunit SecD [Aestuariimicrobium ganziense]
MATQSTRRHHPGRTLLVFLLVCASMFGLMALAKTWTPRLGLDLRGGTTITLTARNTSGSGSVSATSLELARGIIQQRVDSLGVGEAEVTTQGDNHIVVSVPNVQRDELIRLVGQTAMLSFRNIYQSAQSMPPAATPSPTPGNGSAVPSGSASPSTSASPSASPTPSVQATPTPPGLPTAPPPEPTPRPSTPAPVQPELDEKLQWQPSQQDMVDFSTWNCGDPMPDVPDQPLFACDVFAQKYLLGPEIIPGEWVTDAQAGMRQGDIIYVVTLQFNKQGTDAFLAATTRLSTLQDPMNRFAIVLDGDVISSPSVSQPIPGGSAEISGSFNQQTSTELANVLRYGALPLAFDVSSVDNVSASLGGEQLRGGIIAGIVGLILVTAYSFFYYRGLGIVVVGSLVVAGVMTYASMVLLGEAVGFALNLPGIAGAIVAIGMTADSFIIYFERIRDEIRDGRPLRTAIETGWQKARSTIVIADAVSLLSALVLFILAIGAVKGFAFTLGLTTLIDLAIIFFFTKPLMSLLGRTKFFGQGHRLSGLDARHMGVSRDSLLGRRARQTRRRVKEA